VKLRIQKVHFVALQQRLEDRYEQVTAGGKRKEMTIATAADSGKRRNSNDEKVTGRKRNF
jgi:hypothetical protein